MFRLIYSILFSFQIVFCFSQSTTLLTYDANGNRISKKIVGSSSHPIINVSPEAVNPGQPCTLTASGCSGIVQWLPTNQSGSQITVNPTVTTQYTTQCIVAGCTNNGFARTTVNVIQCPAITLTTGFIPEGSVRLGQSISLYAFGCNDGLIRWSTGQVGTPISVQITNLTNTFTATCTKGYCANLGTANAIITGFCPSYAMTASSSASPIRYGQNVTLSSSGCTGGTINWSSGQDANPFTIKIYGPSNTFTALCRDAFCSNMGSASVTVAGITGCLTGDVLVTAQNGNWTVPSTWVCGRIPTISDEVYLNHEIQVNANGSSKVIILGSGFLNYPNSSFIALPQN